MALAADCGIRHVAIIMDGNGRWAKNKGLNRLEGHKQGVEVVREIIKASREFGLEYLTLYAFSTENWKRSKEEVDGLMSLLCEFIDFNLDELQKNNLRLMGIGRLDRLPEEAFKKLMGAIEKTSKNTGGSIVLALNYGGRAEIVDAVKSLVKDSLAGKIKVDEIDEKSISDRLYAPEIPDPELMIRTSGEMRLSNFLLWQLSYSELYITDTLWPDFGREQLKNALESFKGRKRRFGGV